MTVEPALELRNVDAAYGAVGPRSPLVLKNVSLSVARGEWVALVGESGSGKSTAGRLLLMLLRAKAGHVLRFGAPVPPSLRLPSAEHRRVQPVFQHPGAALDPLFDVARTLDQALKWFRPELPVNERTGRSRRLLEETGLAHLPPDRPVRRLSGGEQQRLCIARALAAEPDALVLDEPLSALDAARRASIVELLARLRKERGLAFLFISHDLPLMRAFADRAYVLRAGEIVENGRAADVLSTPRDMYTKKLVDAIPVLDPAEARRRLDAPDEGADLRR